MHFKFQFLYLFIFQLIIFTISGFAQVGPVWSNTYFHWGENGYADKLILNDSGNVYLAGGWTKIDSANTTYATTMIVKYDQAGNIIWTRDYDKDYFNDLTSIVSMLFDKNGNIVIAGIRNSAHYNPSFVLTYSPSGNLIDSISFRILGYQTTSIYSMSIDDNNNIIVLGTCANFSPNLFVSRIKGSVMLWVKTFPNNGTYTTGSSVCTDENMNIYLCGIEYDSIQVDNWIIQGYDSSGNLKWTDIYNGPINYKDRASNILYRNGYIYVSGYGSFPSPGQVDAVVIKIDTSGNRIWVNNYDEGIGNWESILKAELIDDKIYLGGLSLDVNYNSHDFLLIKIDTNGALIFIKSYDFANHHEDMLYDFKCDAAGNCYLAGSNNENDRDWWILKTDSAGNNLFSYDYDNSGHYGDCAYSLAIDSNNVYLTGETYAGSTSMLTMKLGLPSGLPYDLIENDLQVFPNPSHGNITICSSIPMEEIIVYNETGQIVETKNVTSGEFVLINLDNSKSAIYLLKLIDLSGRFYYRKINLIK